MSLPKFLLPVDLPVFLPKCTWSTLLEVNSQSIFSMVPFLHPNGFRNREIVPELLNVVHKPFINVSHNFRTLSDPFVGISGFWRIFAYNNNNTFTWSGPSGVLYFKVD
jgi:hypothetical protein